MKANPIGAVLAGIMLLTTAVAGIKFIIDQVTMSV